MYTERKTSVGPGMPVVSHARLFRAKNRLGTRLAEYIRSEERFNGHVCDQENGAGDGQGAFIITSFP